MVVLKLALGQAVFHRSAEAENLNNAGAAT
jgi:hypothetical protein